jgi:hypothetical protein
MIPLHPPGHRPAGAFSGSLTMSDSTILAEREIKLLRAALEPQAYGPARRRRIIDLADKCASRRPRPFTEPRPTADDFLAEARQDFTELFADMTRAQLEDTAMHLAADAARLRRELDDERGVLR